MADIQGLLRDPEYQGLPFEQRRQLLVEADPEFGAVSTSEQVKILNEMKQQDWWQGGKKTFPKIQPLGKAGTQRDVMGITGTPEMRKAVREPAISSLKDVARFGIETGGQTLGALGGGALGVAGGPVGIGAGGVLGAGAGYATGKRIADYVLGEPVDMSAGGIAGDTAFGAGTQLAGGVIAKGVSKAIPKSVIDKMYASSLKLSTSPSVLPIADRQSLINTGLREKIAPNMKGYEKVLEKIDDFNSQVENLIATGTQKGETVSAFEVSKRLDDLLAKGQRIKKVDPGFEQKIQGIKDEFLDGPDQIPIERAQEMKRHIYKVYQDHYGIDDATAALVTGKKALARGLKEEMEILYPEIKQLNASEGELLKFLDPLGRAVARVQNRDLIGMGMQLAPMTTAAVTGGSSAAAKTGMVAKLIDTPTIKAKLAILLNTAKNKGPGAARKLLGKATPSTAIAIKNTRSSSEGDTE